MIAEYDIARVAIECKRLSTAIDNASGHDIPDWMAHRFAQMKTEALGLAREIANHKEETAGGNG